MTREAGRPPGGAGRRATWAFGIKYPRSCWDRAPCNTIPSFSADREENRLFCQPGLCKCRQGHTATKRLYLQQEKSSLKCSCFSKNIFYEIGVNWSKCRKLEILSITQLHPAIASNRMVSFLWVFVYHLPPLLMARPQFCTLLLSPQSWDEHLRNTQTARKTVV